MTTPQGRQTIYVPKDAEAPLRRLLDWKDGENISTVVNAVSGRYLEVIYHSVPKGITDQEWCFLFDVFKSPWNLEVHGADGMEEGVDRASNYDRLHEKWGVDEKEMIKKLKRWQYAQRLAIVELVEAFWRMQTDQPYDQVIRTLLARLRSSQAPNTQNMRNRMDRRLLPSLSAEGLQFGEVPEYWSEDIEHSAVNEQAEGSGSDGQTAQRYQLPVLETDESSGNPAELTPGPTGAPQMSPAPTRQTHSPAPTGNPVRQDVSPRLDLGTGYSTGIYRQVPQRGNASTANRFQRTDYSPNERAELHSIRVGKRDAGHQPSQ